MRILIGFFFLFAGCSNPEIYEPPHIVIERGSIIYCPYCGKNLYRVTMDIYSNYNLMPAQVEGIGEVPNPKTGEQTDCYFCGKNWFLMANYNFYKENSDK